MVESMHGYVPGGVLNPLLNQVVSNLKCLAEIFGFKMVVQLSKYVYRKDT